MLQLAPLAVLHRVPLDAHHVPRQRLPLRSSQTRFFHPASTLASVRRRVFSSAPLRHPPNAERGGRATATMKLRAHLHTHATARGARRSNLSGHNGPEPVQC
jgi:hypothetical protein